METTQKILDTGERTGVVRRYCIGGAVRESYLRSLNIDESFVRQSSNNEFYHTDALGSTLALSNAAGAVQQEEWGCAGILPGNETMNKAEIVRSIRGERRRTLGLLGTLEPARFDTPTALPRWRVREVAAHLVTTDRGSVIGTILPALLGLGVLGLALGPALQFAGRKPKGGKAPGAGGRRRWIPWMRGAAAAPTETPVDVPGDEPPAEGS